MLWNRVRIRVSRTDLYSGLQHGPVIRWVRDTHVSLHVSQKDRKRVQVLKNFMLFSWEKWGAVGQNPSNQFVVYLILGFHEGLVDSNGSLVENTSMSLLTLPLAMENLCYIYPIQELLTRALRLSDFFLHKTGWTKKNLQRVTHDTMIPPQSSKSNCIRNTDFEFCTIKVATNVSSMMTRLIFFRIVAW